MRIVVLIFISALSAFAHGQAPDLKSPSWRSHDAAQKIFEDEDSARLAPIEVARPSKVVGADQMIVAEAPSRRYLFVKAGGSVIRFHVTPEVMDRDLDALAESLRKACLRAPGDVSACTSEKQIIVEIDRHFFANARDLQVERWPANPERRGDFWKLACASSEDCLSGPSPQIISITARPSVPHAIARGFDALKVRTRSPASERPQRFDRVFVTRESR